MGNKRQNVMSISTYEVVILEVLQASLKVGPIHMELKLILI